MYRILYLPNAEYVINGDSTVDNPNLLGFDTLEEAEVAFETYYFKRYDYKPGISFIYNSLKNNGNRIVIPTYLLEIVEVGCGTL